MEIFSALPAICAENSLVPGEFLAQRPVTRSFDVFFDLRLNKRLSKQWWGWRFETLLRIHYDVTVMITSHRYNVMELLLGKRFDELIDAGGRDLPLLAEHLYLKYFNQHLFEFRSPIRLQIR